MATGDFGKFVSRVKQSAISVAGELTPVLKNSKFRESGMITPDEFVAAGDQLVYHCPTWQWESGEASRRKSYLPNGKQFLVTRKVPCYRRCHQMSVLPENEKVIKLNQDDAEDEGWVDTHHGITLDQTGNDDAQMMTLTDEKQKEPTPQTGMQLMGINNDDSDSDDEIVMDMDDYEDDDPAVVAVKPVTKKQDESVVLQTRTYDLNITYDNYYRTPRLWLFGYDENGKPLTEDQMYEDISQDHLNKTVTMEQHPHLPPPPRASVHPCRHAELMKKIMSMVEEDGRELEVHAYLLVFLKFVQAVIPTIEYDYTHQLSLTST
ncbi:PREDICTED: ubiquitin-like-conjugating enzyme ATG3 [Amphimedon queenslandica]|uniref:Ubiquitin-like-conjugating enzyme ATG3 n=1 Tax=Amphimedon queenslandica TaxID=400682 RepID=A0A1X7U483_AMPQE|nr:PREDICTED: ubiquitin-like-conjugating enzyme ATG3 [Amphimedon queenslandica]|eukprot:XP_003388998.1 PREDICTED: ubiquitin-like-conjugating enzyme ATG3 [Amphimedon queenslandica]